MHITQKPDQNFPLILTGQYNQFQGCVLFVLFSWASRSSQFDSMIKTFPMVVISKIILSLHILCWRLEIRPGIALRLRANLVLLGRRRWKRFLEYWEGKILGKLRGKNTENSGKWLFRGVLSARFVKNSPSRRTLIKLTLSKSAFYARNVFSSLTNYIWKGKWKKLHE